MVKRFLLAQTLGLLLAGVPYLIGYLRFSDPLTFTLLQGACAGAFSMALGLPRWWFPISLLFLPAAVATLGLALPPWLFLVGFVLLALIFWNVSADRVPLFLTNRATIQALGQFMEQHSLHRFMDLGCGVGQVLSALARQQPQYQLFGVESAPLLAALALARAKKITNVRIFVRDLWSQPLSDMDVIYAFLSPVPMALLWEKVSRESSPGSWFISNSFPVPDVPPTQTLQLTDRRQTVLYLYQIRQCLMPLQDSEAQAMPRPNHEAI